MKVALSIERIRESIYWIRSQRVMIDRDLALIYGVETKYLNRQVKRNLDRFPEEFMFQLSKEETLNWRSQFVTSNAIKMGIRRNPFAFTENGVAMLSSVLTSAKAIQVNIQIMRAFVHMKQIALTHKELTLKLNELEKRVGKHGEDIQAIIAAIQQLLVHEEKPKRRMGFHQD